MTKPILTLIDLATCVPAGPLEAAINEADKLDFVSPPHLRVELDRRSGQRGVGALRAILDRATFTLTDSELERASCRSWHVQGSAAPERSSASMVSRSTSTGPIWASSSKPMASGTTEPPSNRPRIGGATRHILPRG